MARPSKYTPETKAQLIAAAREMIRRGNTRQEIAAHLGLNYFSMNAWLREDALSRIYPQKALPLYVTAVCFKQGSLESPEQAPTFS